MSPRTKACAGCKLQKVRWEPLNKQNGRCARCDRLKLKCAVPAPETRGHSQRKSSLQAEIDSLKSQIKSRSQEAKTTMSEYVNPTPIPGIFSQGLARPDPVDPQTFSPPRATEMPRTPAAFPRANDNMNGVVYSKNDGTIHVAVLPRMLADVLVEANEIHDCFCLFHELYLPHLPVTQQQFQADECFTECPLLFWTIVLIGSRKYIENPSLIVRLAPHVLDLAKVMVYTWDAVIPTIQAGVLLCAWPVPCENLYHDVTPMLAGAILQLAYSVGLHVFGVGQDFARTRLPITDEMRTTRQRLWTLCICTCRRVNATWGIPPIHSYDSFKDEAEKQEALGSLTPILRFHRELCQFQDDSFSQIAQTIYATTGPEKASQLNAVISSILASSNALERKHASTLDSFYLQSLRLQIMCFKLHVRPIESSTCQDLFIQACCMIELLDEVNNESQAVELSPIFTYKFIILANFVILRVLQSDARDGVDAARGKKAYFAAIHLCKLMSVRTDDSLAKATVIFTQLWGCTDLFRSRIGDLGSMALHVRSRVGMSLVFDSLWSWRQRFEGLPLPYSKTDETMTGDEPKENALLHDFDVFDYDSNSVLQPEALSSWTGFDDSALSGSIDWYLTSLS